MPAFVVGLLLGARWPTVKGRARWPGSTAAPLHCWLVVNFQHMSPRKKAVFVTVGGPSVGLAPRPSSLMGPLPPPSIEPQAAGFTSEL
jgi:hypothetical protein